MSVTSLLEAGPPPWLRHAGNDGSAGTLQREDFYAAVQRLADTPGFVGAAQASARSVLDFLAHMPMATRGVRDMPMYLLLVCCMHLHHRRNPADPRSYAADTHLRDMLAWAHLRSLLQHAPGAADRRLRRLEPGAPMVSMFRHWLGAFTQAGVVVLPAGLNDGDLPVVELAREVLGDRVAAYAHDGFTPTERYPLIQQLMQVRHGYHVFLALVAGLQPEPVPAMLPLSISALATRFQVARGTVRHTLALAQQHGLLQHDSHAGVVRLSPAFMLLARHWMALELRWMNGIMGAAAYRLQMRAAGAVAQAR